LKGAPAVYVKAAKRIGVRLVQKFSCLLTNSSNDRAVMNVNVGADIRVTICAISELVHHQGRRITHVLSILNPDTPDPDVILSLRADWQMTLRFHDEIDAGPNIILPNIDHIKKIIDIGRLLSEAQFNGAPHILIHCQMGISRSTAAMGTLLAALNPTQDEHEIFDLVFRLRPIAWPNCLMIELADNVLGRRGRLLAALGQLYRKQLDRDPSLGPQRQQQGRGREVALAECCANSLRPGPFG
jgi:predicted protein tyrosine phosphatase